MNDYKILEGKMSKSTYYITTAIDYPNGRPHMGHAYEKIVTDFYARWNRCLGNDTYFLTGTDENGQKLIKSAEEAGKETQEFVDEQVEHFTKLCSDLKITHDDFIRTTEQRHKETCQKLWKILEDRNLIYFDQYEGLYCYSCENFYTESQAVDGKCPHHHIPLEEKKEEGFFFKLSEFRNFLIDHINSNPMFITPDSARKEILSRLEKEELRDLAISRPNTGWGVEVENNEKFVMYTWFDALINYYAGVESKDLTNKLWPANCHVIGKDIVWFHTVIWPSILKACEIPLPKTVYVHGMVLGEDGRKMSKSLGNGVDPADVINEVPVESFRYYILRAISAGADGPFSLKDLKERHNTELGNDFGNLVMRVLKLSIKKVSPEMQSNQCKQEIELDQTHKRFIDHVNKYEHNRALDALWEKIRETNQYINATEPWKVKDDPERLNEILFNCLYAIHCFGFHLLPVMPENITKLFNYLGLAENERLLNPVGRFHELKYKLTEPEILFVKFDI